MSEDRTHLEVDGSIPCAERNNETFVRKTRFARERTFAIAKAPTKTRIDLGLRLPGVKPTKRLAATTAFSDNATHCVILTKSGDVDVQLEKWLKRRARPERRFGNRTLACRP